MAARQISMATRPSCYMKCLLVLILAVAAWSSPAQASSPSSLVVYATRYNQDTVITASPSGNLTAIELGTTVVYYDTLRETQAPNSTVIGSITGEVIYGKDLSSTLMIATYFLNSTSFAGTITTQNDAVTGGTQDFGFARGYLNATSLYQDATLNAFKIVFYLKYD